EVERRYRALVWGRFAVPRGMIDAPIGRSLRRPTRMAVREGGRDARTEFDVLVAHARPEVTLLDCRLQTGRTHQIRGHLQSIGHPVVGDAAYGGDRPGVAIGRPFLHAGGLKLEHPKTSREIDVVEPLPGDLEAVLAALEHA